MTTLMAIVAVVLGAAGAFVLYLGSPNQSLLAQPLASGASGSACVVGLLGSLLLFLQVAGPATAVYLLLTVVMLTWSLPPLAVGWWRQRASREP
jgi:hypothetical protein